MIIPTSWAVERIQGENVGKPWHTAVIQNTLAIFCNTILLIF